VLNRSIDPNVRPDTCYKRFLPQERIFSLMPSNRMVPGVLGEHAIPTVSIPPVKHPRNGWRVGEYRICPASHRRLDIFPSWGLAETGIQA